MADIDTRVKHSRKRNLLAKHLRDPNEHKGAFALKVVDHRKNNYKRAKIRINNIQNDEE